MANKDILKQFGLYALKNSDQKPLTITAEVNGYATKDFKLSAPATDKDGVNITGDIFISVRPQDSSGRSEQMYLPPNSITDGIIVTGAIRGVNPNAIVIDGDEYPEGSEDFALDIIPSGSVVECVFHPFQFELIIKAIMGEIFTGGNTLSIGADDEGTVLIKSNGQNFLQKLIAPAYLTGGTSPETNYATWEAIADGSFRITIDGVGYNVDGIDFTGVTSIVEVSEKLETALNTVTGGDNQVIYEINKFVIIGSHTGDSSTITVTTTSTGTVGTDISGVVGTWLDCNAGTVTDRVEKCQYSDDGSAWSDLSTVGAHGVLALFKDHTDVDSAVSDSPAEGEILIYDGIWKKGFPERMGRALGESPFSLGSDSLERHNIPFNDIDPSFSGDIEGWAKQVTSGAIALNNSGGMLSLIAGASATGSFFNRDGFPAPDGYVVNTNRRCCLFRNSNVLESRFEWKMFIGNPSGASPSGNRRIGVATGAGNDTLEKNYNDLTFATTFFGFAFSGANIYAVTIASPTNYSITDITAFVDITKMHTFRIDVKLGDKIVFYVDNVAVATENDGTKITNGYSQSYFGCGMNGTAANDEIALSAPFLTLNIPYP